MEDKNFVSIMSLTFKFLHICKDPEITEKTIKEFYSWYGVTITKEQLFLDEEIECPYSSTQILYHKPSVVYLETVQDKLKGFLQYEAGMEEEARNFLVELVTPYINYPWKETK